MNQRAISWQNFDTDASNWPRKLVEISVLGASIYWTHKNIECNQSGWQCENVKIWRSRGLSWIYPTILNIATAQFSYLGQGLIMSWGPSLYNLYLPAKNIKLSTFTQTNTVAWVCERERGGRGRVMVKERTTIILKKKGYNLSF